MDHKDQIIRLGICGMGMLFLLYVTSEIVYLVGAGFFTLVMIIVLLVQCYQPPESLGDIPPDQSCSRP